MFRPCRCEFSPKTRWTEKNHIYTRVYSTPFEKGTERVCTIQPCNDSTWSFSVFEFNADLSLVETLGTSAGRGYSRSLTNVMTACDRLASKVYKYGREPKIIQTTLSI